MTRFKLYSIGTLVAGAVLFGGAMSTNPALAQQTYQMVLSIVNCNSTSPCTGGSNTGTGPGVEGTSTQGQGIVGQTNGTVGSAPGLAGVLGQDLARQRNAKFNSGVSGTSIVGSGVTGNSSRGEGVFGAASANNGIEGDTANPSKTSRGASGVYGFDASTDGGHKNVGVGGFSPNGIGVSGNSTNGAGVSGNSGLGEGVFGTASVNNGIEGDTANPSKTSRGASGVYGFDASTDGGSKNVGVGGFSPNGTGVSGTSSNYIGVSGTGPTPLAGMDNAGNRVFTVTNVGNVEISGLIYTQGVCSTGCARGRRLVSYAPRESLPTIEDIGQARLVNGQAYVRIEPAFANSIDKRARYDVFTEPEGDNRGLYVTSKTASSFVVRESQGGHSTLDFGYRIVAKPFGSTEKRLPMVEVKPMSPLGRI